MCQNGAFFVFTHASIVVRPEWRLNKGDWNRLERTRSKGLSPERGVRSRSPGREPWEWGAVNKESPVRAMQGPCNRGIAGVSASPLQGSSIICVLSQGLRPGLKTTAALPGLAATNGFGACGNQRLRGLWQPTASELAATNGFGACGHQRLRSLRPPTASELVATNGFGTCGNQRLRNLWQPTASELVATNSSPEWLSPPGSHPISLIKRHSGPTPIRVFVISRFGQGCFSSLFFRRFALRGLVKIPYLTFPVE